MMKKALNKILFIQKSFWRKTKGFSLVGVMVAAAVGLIVSSGIVQLFVNMGDQLKNLENRAEVRNIQALLTRNLQNPESCFQSLNTTAIRNFIYSGWTAANSFHDFKVAKDAIGNTIIDLSDASAVEARFGLKGHVSFRIQCGASTCKDCSAAGNWAAATGFSRPICQNQWTIELLSQSVLKGVHIHNRPQKLLSFNAIFTDSSDPAIWRCGAVTAPLPCMRLSAGVADGRTLVGCGAQRYTGKNNTVFGFQNSGAKSTGTYNSVLGHRAGAANTTGEANVFTGAYAGFGNTTGKNNTFVGYAAGFLDASNEANVFIGHSAGYNNKGKKTLL